MLMCELARRQRGWSQMQLGHASRIPQTFISLIECGRGIPTADQADRLSRALDVPVDLLLKPVVLPELGEARRA